MRTIEKAVYLFTELDDLAKENAREWYRQGNDAHEWWENVYKQAAEAANLLGIDLRQTRTNLMNGVHRYDPTIYFSGFSSQGDGACFEGEYKYRPGALKLVKEEFPNDKTLQDIARALQVLQRPNFYHLTCAIKHRGHYNHSGCMDIDVSRTDDVDFSQSVEEDLKQCMRDFANWIYDRLEAEWDYLNSDEQVEEAIIANEYEFDENGDRVL